MMAGQAIDIRITFHLNGFSIKSLHENKEVISWRLRFLRFLSYLFVLNFESD